MPYRIKDLVFRLELRDPNHIVLKLEENKEQGQDLGKDIVLRNCGGRTSGTLVTNVVEEQALVKLMEKLRQKLGNLTTPIT